MGTLFDEFTRLFELAEADKAKIYGFTERDALLIIDMQNDFMRHIYPHRPPFSLRLSRQPPTRPIHHSHTAQSFLKSP